MVPGAMQGPPIYVYQQLTRLSIAPFDGRLEHLADDWMASIQGSRQLSELEVRHYEDSEVVDIAALTQTADSLPSLTLLQLHLPEARSPNSVATIDSMFKLARSRQRVMSRGGSVHIEGMRLVSTWRA